jgi:hypothetical protein
MGPRPPAAPHRWTAEPDGAGAIRQLPPTRPPTHRLTHTPLNPPCRQSFRGTPSPSRASWATAGAQTPGTAGGGGEEGRGVSRAKSGGRLRGL